VVPDRHHRIALHGAAIPRGLEIERGAAPTQGRFGAMFPGRDPCEADAAAIEALVEVMDGRKERLTQNRGVPAGFTYLAQFIDHDLTFDPTPFTDRRHDPHALVNFRTPRLDLDSVYGLGPDVQPHLYDWDSEPPGARLLVGCNPRDGTVDLPRNQQERALIGDPRNDENLILAQLHLLFICFHNAVVDHLAGERTPRSERFETARQLVRRHYQWIVVHDFLPKVVGGGMARRVLAGREFFEWRGEPFMPFEFSGAAYRFGHSMVRDRYGLKRLPPTGSGADSVPFGELAGHRALTRRHVIDWERFFDLGAPRGPQASFPIDTALAKPLFELPDGEPALARRNLLRGLKLGLPSGQDVADALGAPVLEPEELQIDENVESRDVLLRSTPLWYYVLCEAEQRAKGKQLGPVGGRIVGEVLVGLLEADTDSYLNADPAWEPGQLGTPKPFTMATLVGFAQRAPGGGA
jgi:hypothetical protein